MSADVGASPPSRVAQARRAGGLTINFDLNYVNGKEKDIDYGIFYQS